ncbi:CheR family methyltransferase [Pseudooceanicola onchidii]|uniref:CheR family methyltransferase n=1 Tax=Pseudooceanicola onchidii TaxID=2562279 RepID=UPI0010AB1B90|nr:CheR family methyltransferase [Pseudooceanicola onchidii]
MRDQESNDPQQIDGDTERLCIVGIGASAGGLEAIREMLAGASPDANLAYVVIQHLDPNHESLLAELLARHTDLAVRQVSGGEKIQSGNVYIIPPGVGLSVSKGVLDLTAFSQPRGLRRPIDDFFESLAIDQGRFAACVILSGTGADGSVGLRAIKEHGGLCIVQDPESAKYDGMPTSAQNTGLVDFVRRPSDIVEAIRSYYTHSFLGKTDTQLASTIETNLTDICAVVRNFVGHDFSGYKQSTLVRRVQRRVQVLNLDNAEQYLQHIRSDPRECELLFRDLLINVTRFFRDADHFEVLRKTAIRPLVKNSGNEDDIRIWVPGCSSGEEAYTIAMMIADECRLQKRSVNVQIFATDIDEQMLRIAREGTYAQAALGDIPEQMRDAYTIGRDGHFQVSAKIRDMIRFSVHSIVRDPPFSNIDLLSCRNLLIYFGDQLQKAAMPIFHYAIKPGGILFLGPSETVGRFDHAFQAIDQSARVFRRNDSRPEYPLHLRHQEPTATTNRRRPQHDEEPSKRLEWGDGGATDRILAAYAPATLRVTASGEILKSTGRLGKYLDYSIGGDSNRFAPSIARPGVREAISAIIRQVSRNKKRTISRDLTAQSEFGTQDFDLIGEPLPDGSFLLVFRESDRFTFGDDEDFESVLPMDSHVQSLEDELRSTRVRLHTTVEELETANEELKSSNEEMMSMNEELQSTNEELSTVNDELKGKVDELSVANSDLSNFFASTALPLVVVDADMAIRNYTVAIQSIYPFRNSDRGRPLTEVTSALRQDSEMLEATREVMRDGEVRHLRVWDRNDERIWSLVITPYRSRDGQLDGATLVFSELTDAVRLEDALEQESERLRLALDVSNLSVWEFDPVAGTVRIDPTGAVILGLATEHPSAEDFYDCVHDDDRDRVKQAFRAASGDGDQIDVTFRTRSDDATSRFCQIVGQRMHSRKSARVLGVVFDVTREQEDRDVRELMLREMNHRVKNMFAIISGMLRIVGRSANSVADLVEAMQLRITALARSHDMTQRAPAGEALTLADVVAASVEPYDAHSEISIDGPEVAVDVSELTALSLLLHEWATNAAKYGALGARDGRLAVTWAKNESKGITLTWNEVMAQDVVRSEEKAGFGSTLVQLSAMQLDGRLETTIDANTRRMTLEYVPNSEGSRT